MERGEADRDRHDLPLLRRGLHAAPDAQDGRLVKAASPLDNAITLGNLCIKGRFGWRFVQPVEPARDFGPDGTPRSRS